MSEFETRRPLVRVMVTETRDSGVYVKVHETARSGYIRRRELSWDRRVRVIPRMPQPGEEIDAVVLGDDDHGYLRLSTRLLTDPWKDVISERRYRKGQQVEGEVVNIRHYGAYVQVEPGVDAVLWFRDIPRLPNQAIDEILRVGDRVLGVIKELDLERRKMELSIWDALCELEATEHRWKTQVELFEDKQAAFQTLESFEQPVSKMVTGSGFEVVRRFHPPIARPKRFLVVDDDANDLDLICRRLEQEYGVQVLGVRNGDEAAAAIKQGLAFGMALIDLKLNGEHGTEVAEKIWRVRGDQVPILFMSAAQPLDLETAAIDTVKTPLIEKNADEVIDWVDRMCSGYLVDQNVTANEGLQGGDLFVRQLEMTAFARRSLEDRLQEMLAALRKHTQVAQTLVVELDLADRTVSVIAADPPLPDYIVERSIGALYYSPVRGVIEDEEEVRVNQIQQRDLEGRFKNFFPLLSYRSCFGIPLMIPDHVTRHALFVLDGRFGSFDIRRRKRRVQQCQQAGRFLGVAIERSLLLEHMRRYQKRYSQGQLAEDLIHELNNKLSGLRTQAARLQGIMPEEPCRSNSGTQDWFDKAKDAVAELAGVETELRELVKSYERLARHDFDAVDVNEVVQKVRSQLERTAREAGVDIVLDLGVDLPSARCIYSQLQQVVMNLVLNAIQQIKHHQQQFRAIRQELPGQVLLLSRGQVVVQTRCQDSGLPWPVQIRVIDTGPGAHWQQRDRIFSMGFSNRGGAGLGLFISRNLIEATGGQVTLAASMMLVGSMFVIELPHHTSPGDGK